MLAGERPELVAGLAFDHAAPQQEQRLLRALDRPRGQAHRLRVGLGRRHARLGRAGRAGLARRLAVGHVLWQVDDGRARPAGLGQRVRLAHVVAHRVGRGGEVAVFGDRARDPDRVGLLEGVAAHHLLGHLSRQREHGVRVHPRVGQAGHDVGHARPRGDETDARLPRDHAVGVGRVCGPLLVGHRHVPDRRVVQRVVDGHDRAPLDAEGRAHAGVLEGPDHRRRAGGHRRRVGRLARTARLARRPRGVALSRLVRLGSWCRSFAHRRVLVGVVVGGRLRRWSVGVGVGRTVGGGPTRPVRSAGRRRPPGRPASAGRSRPASRDGDRWRR